MLGGLAFARLRRGIFFEGWFDSACLGLRHVAPTFSNNAHLLAYLPLVCIIGRRRGSRGLSGRKCCTLVRFLFDCLLFCVVCEVFWVVAYCFFFLLCACLCVYADARESVQVGHALVRAGHSRCPSSPCARTRICTRVPGCASAPLHKWGWGSLLAEGEGEGSNHLEVIHLAAKRAILALPDEQLRFRALSRARNIHQRKALERT